MSSYPLYSLLALIALVSPLAVVADEQAQPPKQLHKVLDGVSNTVDSGAKLVSSVAEKGASRVNQVTHDHAKRVAARAEQRADAISSAFETGSRAVSSAANFGSRNVRSFNNGIEVHVENFQNALPQVPGLGLLSSATRGFMGLAGNFTGEGYNMVRNIGSSILNMGRRTGSATMQSLKASANRLTRGNKDVQQINQSEGPVPITEDPMVDTAENAAKPNELQKVSDSGVPVAQDDQSTDSAASTVEGEQHQASTETPTDEQDVSKAPETETAPTTEASESEPAEVASEQTEVAGEQDGPKPAEVASEQTESQPAEGAKDQSEPKPTEDASEDKVVEEKAENKE